MIVRIVDNFDRTKTIIKSIPKLWIETYENKDEQSYIISFGNENGSVMYVYETSKPYEIDELVRSTK